MIKVHNLTKAYDNLLVVKDANFDISENQIVGLLGPNGSGKTTIIKLINDLIKPTTGHIEFKGEKLNLNAKNCISYLPERSALNISQTVKSAIKMYSDFFLDFNSEHALHILKLLDIPTSKRLSQLSKGQKGKVQLALTFGRKVDLYILDEPLDGMDPASRDLIMKIILKYKKENSSILISTHQITDIEDYLDSAILLKNGEVIEFGLVSSLNQLHNMKLSQYFKEVYKYDEEII
ncbi:ABC transporter ATP-binding protein [Acholeplasma granularum]|uniref:ABC transporter ATP-binding protein n=1 Tax=Acholeplasma granularum TaxID=264635 RepID=UPI0004B50E6C|nr:ABC transporter ATP-binding protein [Acholeplasma granularum]